MNERPEVCVFIATSLDNFIARPDGALDWLLERHALAPAGEDFGYAAFMADVDALVMGRKTFEAALGFDPWPYAGTPVHLMTRQPGLTLPSERQGDVRIRQEEPGALLSALWTEGVRRVYLDGGELIQAFVADDLVDRVTVTTVPVLIGQGRRLWGALDADLAWTLEAVRHWDCGFVQTLHRRMRPSPGGAPAIWQQLHPTPA